jgi:hypothetical protein
LIGKGKSRPYGASKWVGIWIARQPPNGLSPVLDVTLLDDGIDFVDRYLRRQ